MFKKKSLFSIVVLFLLSLVIAACSGDDDAASSNVEDNNEDENASTGESYTIRFGHHDAEVSYEENPYHAYADTFKKEVEEMSDGRITVDIYPNSQLGDLRSMVEQASNGEIEIVGGADVGLLSAYTNVVEILSVPFAFEDEKVASDLLDGKLGEKLTEEISEKSNLQMISYLPTALRHFSNSKHEIRTPEDMKGLKMRTQEIPIHQEMMKALGAVPIAIPFEEVYSALQTGVAEGQENAPYTMTTMNLHEVQDYYTLNGHLVNIATIMINQDFFDQLSDEDKDIIMQAGETAKTVMIDIIAEKNEKDLKMFEESGMTITELTPEEREAFRDVTLEPVLDILREKVDEEWIELLLEEADIN